MSDDSQTPQPSSLRASIAVDTPRQAFDYMGSAGDLAKIVTVNMLLGILTLGIYRFWGKTRLRRYFWSHVSFEGEPLEYTGRAMELFLGFLIVIAILVPVGFLLGFIDYSLIGQPEVRGAYGIVQALVIIFLIYVALFRARRYRLTRTQWRGIRGGQSGSALQYALMAFGWIVVTGLTLGLAYPLMQTRLQAYLIENTWFGSKNLSFSGEAKALFPRWLIAWLLLAPTLGFSWLWYQVQVFRYFVGQTRYGDLGFTSELSFRRVLWIIVCYVVIVGLAVALVSFFFELFVPGGFLIEISDSSTPLSAAVFVSIILYVLVLVLIFNVCRVAVYLNMLFREVTATLTVTGEEDFDAIRQSAQEQPRFGEGLADALDVGSI